jgi:hypothetical protein
MEGEGVMLDEANFADRFKPSWDEDSGATVKRLWDEGRNASEIGRTLGRTRSAILGYIHRKGWQRHRTKNRVTHVRYDPDVKPGPKPPPRPTLAERVKLPIAAKTPIIPEPLALFKTLVALADNECHFAVTKDAPHSFCGQPTADRSSYCPHHRAVTTRIVSLEEA